MVKGGTVEHRIQVLLGASTLIRTDLRNYRILSLDRGGRCDGGRERLGRDLDQTGLVVFGIPERSTSGVFKQDGGRGLQNLDLDGLGHSLEDLVIESSFELDIVFSGIDDSLHGNQVAFLVLDVEDGLVPVRGDRYGVVAVDGIVHIEGELVLEVRAVVGRILSGLDGNEFGREVGLDDLEIPVYEEAPGLRVGLFSALSEIREGDLGSHRIRIESGIDDIALVQNGAVGDRFDPEGFLRNKGDDLCAGVLEPLLVDELAIPLDRDVADTEVHILVGTEVLHPHLVEEALFELVVGIDEEEEIVPRIFIAIYHDARILDVDEPSHVFGFAPLSKVDAFNVGEIGSETEISTVLHLSALLNKDLPFNPYRAAGGVHQLRTGHNVNDDILGDICTREFGDSADNCDVSLIILGRLKDCTAYDDGSG